MELELITNWLINTTLGNVAGAAILIIAWNAILRALTPDQRYTGRWGSPGRRMK